MEMQCWNYLDTVEVIGSIPVAPIFYFPSIDRLTGCCSSPLPPSGRNFDRKHSFLRGWST